MLFKILYGDKSRISTNITPYHEGYCYVTYDGDFYVDMNNERVKLNAKDAETLTGMSYDDIITYVNTQLDTKSDAEHEHDNMVTVEGGASFVLSDVFGEGPYTIEFTDEDDDGELEYVETDPTVPAWAKAPNKPTYTAAEVGALPASTVIPSIEGLASETYVNNKIAAIPTPDITIRWW